MLVLSRKIGEKVLVGDDVEVVVLEIRSNRVRLGITAPRQVRVDRPEVRLNIELEEQSATSQEASAPDENDPAPYGYDLRW